MKGRRIIGQTPSDLADEGARPFKPKNFWRGPVVAFLVLLLAIGIPGYLFLKRQISAWRTSIENQLLAVADLKAGQISEWNKEREAQAEVFFDSAVVRAGARAFLSGPPVASLAQDLTAMMDEVQKKLGFSEVILYGADGRSLLATPTSRAIVEASRDESFGDALRSNRITREDLHFEANDADAGRTSIRLDFWIPIPATKDSKAAAAGVWLLRIDPYRFLYPLIQSWPMPSPTAETLLVRREGNDAVFLNDLRHRENTALRLRVPLDSRQELPAAMAVEGRRGVVEGRDYRETIVLAAIRDIPGTPWFIVSKIDRGEVFAPLKKQAVAMAMAILGIILAVTLGWILWERRREELLLRDRLDRERKRRLAEEALSETMTRYRNLVDNMSSGVAVYETADGGADFVFKDFNKAAERIDRVRKEDVLGRKVTEAFPGVRDLGLLEVFQRVSRTGVPEHHPAGIYKDERIAGWRENFIYKLPSGEIVAVYDDITERKRAEERIARYAEELELRVRERTGQLEAANKDLEAFTYSVSHDLRAPLRGIDGWSLAFMEDFADSLDERGGQYLARVRAEAQRMGMLIDDLLQLSRVGSAEMKSETVDLSSSARKIAARLEEIYLERTVEFILQPDLRAHGDSRLIEIALHNLLDNAWKFTARRSAARVEFGLAEKEGERVFYVRDNGTGFDMAYAAKLFTAFQRLHKSSEFPGTGIGLATVRRIVCRHGGRVWAEARLDEGATFFFTLPD